MKKQLICSLIAATALLSFNTQAQEEDSSAYNTGYDTGHRAFNFVKDFVTMDRTKATASKAKESVTGIIDGASEAAAPVTSYCMIMEHNAEIIQRPENHWFSIDTGITLQTELIKGNPRAIHAYNMLHHQLKVLDPNVSILNELKQLDFTGTRGFRKAEYHEVAEAWRRYWFVENPGIKGYRCVTDNTFSSEDVNLKAGMAALIDFMYFLETEVVDPNTNEIKIVREHKGYGDDYIAMFSDFTIPVSKKKS